MAADAASVRNTPGTLGSLFFPSIAVVVANLPVNLVYSLVDPRIEPGEGS